MPNLLGVMCFSTWRDKSDIEEGREGEKELESIYSEHKQQVSSLLNSVGEISIPYSARERICDPIHWNKSKPPMITIQTIPRLFVNFL